MEALSTGPDLALGILEALIALIIFIGGIGFAIIKWSPLRNGVVWILRASINHHDRDLLGRLSEIEGELGKLQNDKLLLDSKFVLLESTTKLLTDAELDKRICILEYKVEHIIKVMNIDNLDIQEGGD